jgi:(p)ppGpp synthase/HD superfamily hydrolase
MSVQDLGNDRRCGDRNPMGMVRLHVVALQALARQRQWSFTRMAQAVALAAMVHDGQTRMSNGDPYLVHPLMTARLVGAWGGSQNDVIAAVLHDTVEDTPADPVALLEHIVDTFGHDVATVVTALTKQGHLAGAARQQDQHDRIMALGHTQGPGVCWIKLADRAHNSVTSQCYSAAKLTKLEHENCAWFAPMALSLGAMDLAHFLGDAARWHKVPEALFVETLATMVRKH